MYYPRKLRRLQWRLTGAYMLASVVSIVVLLLVGAVLVGMLFAFSNASAAALANLLARAVVTGRPVLLSAHTRPEAAAAWLTSLGGEGGVNPRYLSNGLEAAQLLGPIERVALVDAAGNVLVARPPDFAAPGTALATHLAEDEVETLRAALAGNTDSTTLSERTSDSRLVAAMPIFDDAGVVRGAVSLSLRHRGWQTVAQISTALIQTFLPVVISASLLAVITGLIFGALLARNLTRRLDHLVKVADTWSTGDLSVVARDRTGDEISHLARHLNEMAEDLRNLLQLRETLAAMEERNRLARDLHDSVKQQIFAIGMQVAAARDLLTSNPGAAATLLDETEQLTHTSQQELTQIIHALRPADLEQKGLAQVIRDYVSDWSRRSGIAAEVRLQGERRLPLAKEQALFRVVQEALANTARHSGASSVDVHICWQPQQITLTVRDNGRGFDQTSARRGVGLESMRERMAAIGGELRILSTTGGGTSIVAQMAI